MTFENTWDMSGGCKMACCKIGCKCEGEEIIWEQSLDFKNRGGSIIRTKIQGCKEHPPETILCGVTNEDILRDKGY
jgi:hypothetical protein